MDIKERLALEKKELEKVDKKLKNIESNRKKNGLKPLVFGREPNNIIVGPGQTYKKR